MTKTAKTILIIAIVLVILFFVLAGLLALGIGVWYFWDKDNNTNLNTNVNSSLNYNYNTNYNYNSNQNTNTASSNISWETSEIYEYDEVYSAYIYYPVFSGFSDTSKQTYLNNAVKTYVDTYLSSFISSATYDEYYEDDYSSTLDINYTVVMTNEDLASIEIDIYEYYSGAAHGISYVHGLNYDLNQQYELYLSDFFLSNSNYINKISEYCIDKLETQLGTDYYDESVVQEGAGAYEYNYYNFTFDKDGFTFIFPAYQVAPYAAGTQEVTMSYSEFDNILNYDLLTFLDRVN